MRKKFVHISQTGSTNDYIRGLTPPDNDEMLVVTTDYQSAGRGQGTNRWESEPGENLLCSIMVAPQGIKPVCQFLLSEAGALAVADALDHYTDGISLKWPNDVYWYDRKISGTLIQTSMASGALRHCIYGIGVNINQRLFRSDAPNPVSLRQITGHVTDCQEVLQYMLEALEKYLTMLYQGDAAQVREAYHSRLYRCNGVYPFRDAQGDFMAEILHVADEGPITLRDTQGHLRTYHFKELQFIIP